jgi:predicted DNA-binding transcriptional regulator YafY
MIEEGDVARAARLLNMLIRLRAAPRLTAQELADEFEVSRRTMQRDLQTLTELGVRFAAVPGPGGGYTLARDQRLAPLTLTVDEALGVLLSYDAFARYAQPPFTTEGAGLSAVTKLRAALSPDAVRELERLSRHVAIIARPIGDPAPLLNDLLRAALDEAYLHVVYDSKSGRSERIIFPFGIYAMGGCWYCACHDEKRGANISLRADRVVALTRAEGGRERPPHIPLAQWLDVVERDDGRGLPLRATVTPRGMLNYDLRALFGAIQLDGHGGGVIVGAIPHSEGGWYASQLLAVGPDVVVESPPELIAAICAQADAVARLYRRRCSRPAALTGG